MSDQEHWGINEFAVIPPIDEHRRSRRAAAGPKRLDPAYFMELPDAIGAADADRNASTGDPIAITAEKQLPRIPSAEE